MNPGYFNPLSDFLTSLLTTALREPEIESPVIPRYNPQPRRLSVYLPTQNLST